MILISRLVAAVVALLRPLVPIRRTGDDVVILHQLLVGDGILIIPLLDAMRHRTSVSVACPGSLIDLYRMLFPAFSYHAFSEKRPLSVLSFLWRHRGASLVVCPIERRLHRYAFATGAQRIIGFGTNNGNACGLSLSDLPSEQMTFSDMMAHLVGLRTPFVPLDNFGSKELRCILHTDARNPNRRWTLRHWKGLAELLRTHGFKIIWCNGPEGTSPIGSLILREDYTLIPKGLTNYLDEIQKASLLICPDTGIAHLAKLTRTPTAVIYGQGNPGIHGNGFYWKHAKTINIFNGNVYCRDKNTLMGIPVKWLNRCDKTPIQCKEPWCQNGLDVIEVFDQLQRGFPLLFSEH